jgi:hypothetical protein
MPFLITFGIGSALLVFGMIYRHWRVAPLTFNDFMALVIGAYGVGGAPGFAVLPGIWLAVSYSLTGGRLEDHLFPGSNLGTLFIGIVVGVLVSLGWAVKSYLGILTRPEPPRRRRASRTTPTPGSPETP